MREAVGGVGRELDELEQLARRARAAARPSRPRWRHALGDDRRDRMRGSSEPNGSWKTICASLAERRAARRAERRARRARRSGPRRRVGSISRSISRASVLLPQPLSPTSASVSPGATSRSTSSTAESQLVGRPRHVARRPGSASSARARGAAAQPCERVRGCSSGAHGRPRSRSSAGCVSSQRSIAVRAARREAAGRAEAGRGRARARRSPAARLPRRRAPACCAAGPACRDGAGASKIVRAGPLSTISPAYMTATRSAISSTTPRSWVIRSTLIPSSSRSSTMQLEDLRLDRHVERRGRLVGDQQLGLEQRAPSRSSTRWRMPPENWCG